MVRAAQASPEQPARLSKILGQGQRAGDPFCESWLAGISLPARECAAAGCASMPAGAASRYALGADGAGAARPAPAASLISASRYALRAQRTALRAEGAARLCARRSRWLPSPGLALRARCRGCGRCAPGRLRQFFAASRYAHGAEGVGAARPGAFTCCPPAPVNARVASWWWGRRRCGALHAARDARCKARFALLPRARVGRGGPDIIMRKRAGERLCAAAACAVRVGAERR
jgi:hypothetical protein